LLAVFQLERDGDQIRIVDSDGSVYEGGLVAGVQSQIQQQNNLQTMRGAQAMDGFKANANLSAQNMNGLPVQGFRFMATGTNVNLQESVVITGEFLAAAEAGTNPMTFANAQQAGQLNAPTQNAAQNNAPSFTGRLVGRVITADGREVELNAVGR
jgi:hypothetical protein